MIGLEISKLDVNGHFRYLWLKRVEGVDLGVHCARCLLGTYSEEVGVDKPHVRGLELADGIWYLCGVTDPYRWRDNFHCAFVIASEGDGFSVSEHGVSLEVRGAVRLPISPASIDPADPHSHVKAYWTCRNWQFAHYLNSCEETEVRRWLRQLTSDVPRGREG